MDSDEYTTELAREEFPKADPYKGRIKMESMEQKIKNAETAQEYWNHCLTKQQRENIMDNNETFANYIYRKSGCETQCTTCLCIMDTAPEPIRCTECGGDTVSPYYC